MEDDASQAQGRRPGEPGQLDQLRSQRSPPRLARGAYIASNVEHGRLISPVRRDVATSFVVMQSKAIEGLDLQQIADYCAFVGLGPVKTVTRDVSAASSILSLFADQAGPMRRPPSLTAFDLAYLRALYTGSTGYPANQKLTTIWISILRDLRSSPDDPLKTAVR